LIARAANCDMRMPYPNTDEMRLICKKSLEMANVMMEESMKDDGKKQ
jgi:hypothetical protein